MRQVCQAQSELGWLQHLSYWNKFFIFDCSQETHTVSGFLLACGLGLSCIFDPESFDLTKSLLHLRNNEGSSGLHLAAAAGHDEIILQLLRHVVGLEDEGARKKILNARDAIGWTPLDVAAKRQRNGVTQLLLWTPEVDLSGGPFTYSRYAYVLDEWSLDESDNDSQKRLELGDFIVEVD